jgi:hypothetical protein
MIAKADIRRVREWMGQADIQTTMRYLHFAPRDEDPALVAEAFAVAQSADEAIHERSMTRAVRNACLQAEVSRWPEMSADVRRCCVARRLKGPSQGRSPAAPDVLVV